MSQKIIANLLRYANHSQAKHLVITSDAGSVNCHYHLPAGTVTALSLPKKLEQDFLNDLRRLLEITPHELIQQKYCKLKDKDYHLAFYLTVLPHNNGEKFIMSIVGHNHQPWRLNQLGLQNSDLRLIHSSLKNHSGLMIVSSPHHNGKTSTLYSLLNTLNKAELSIYEITKKPEQEIPGVNIVEPTKANWEKVLNHDSDVIVVDDLDNSESLIKAWRAAATGRLVLGALTADSAIEVLEKILKTEKGKERLEAVKMIINQRLTDLKKQRSTRKVGRRNVEARKQIGLFEVLKLTPEVLKEINKDKSKITKIKLEQILKKTSFRPLIEDRRQKTKDGIIK